jgi:glycosyltransferase involved in cell wall biosynthesis
MNLLHVIPYYAPAWAYGGSVRAATDLTRALASAGHSVYVLTTDTLGPTERIRARYQALGGVRVIRVRNLSNTLRGRLNLSTPLGIRRAAQRLIERHAIDVVHCHELRTVENLRVVPLARQLGVPVVVSPHGTLPLDTGRASVKRLWDTLFDDSLRHYNRVIALTEIEAQQARDIWLKAGLPVRCSIVPNGVHVEDYANLPSGEIFRERWRLGTGPVVLFLGRLHERKGLHLLIPAFAEAVKLAPDARLVIAGPDEGMLGPLRSQVDHFNLAQRAIFTGMLTGPDKFAALAAADLFALPAVGEGFSMAVLEAMACALPVILTPGCNFPEAQEAGAGLVVPRTIPDLSRALGDLLTNAARRASMGRAARDLVHARYTWPQVVAQLEDVYRAVVQ